MEWKQPIPTSLDNSFGDDKIAYTLFLVLLVRARNDDGVAKLGRKFVKLSKGQSLFGRNSLSKYFGLSPSGIEKVLKRLEIVHSKVTCNRTRNHTIVTIKNYDEIVSMSPAKYHVGNKKVTSKEHVGNTNKSVKSNKSVKRKRVRTYESTKTKKKYTLDQVATTTLEIFNQEMDTNFKSVKPFLSGIEFWLETYAPNEIEKAIKQLPYNGFWKDKMTPTMLFRRKNPRGEPVDYLGELINSRRTKWNR